MILLENNILYCGLGGSRAKNVNIINSDYDYVCVKTDLKDEVTFEVIQDKNLITWTTESFFRRLYDTKHMFRLDTIFLGNFLEENNFTHFIKENREDFVYKNLGLLLESYEDNFNWVKEYFTGLYRVSKKILMYSFLHMNILIDLPQGKEPIKCFCPEGELHDFLINIRNGEYSEEYLWNEFLKLEEQKNKELKFYEAPRDEEFFRMVKNEIDKYNFLPYEDWKLMNQKN